MGVVFSPGVTIQEEELGVVSSSGATSEEEEFTVKTSSFGRLTEEKTTCIISSGKIRAIWMLVVNAVFNIEDRLMHLEAIS